MNVRLEDLGECFQGIVPSLIATCSRRGEPNITYLSQVFYVDSKHVALSCQFFNKTRRNIDENPWVTILLHHPVTFETFHLRARFVRAETEGPLFETMAARIQVIASHTGMAGVFELISADVCEVWSLTRCEGFLLPPDPVLDAVPDPPPADGPLTELRGLQVVTERVARAGDLEGLLNGALTALDELLGFSPSMVLLLDENASRLFTVASRGYGAEGIGAEVPVGAGVIGTAAERRRMVRVCGVGGELSYGRAIRQRAAETGAHDRIAQEIPLPGLPDAQAQMALPLLVGERLLGVLAVESRNPLCFDDWDEAYLQIVANQIAAGIDRMTDEATEPAPGVATSRRGGASASPAQRKRAFTFYANDDCVFVDGEYLVRNVPGRILWKLLREYTEQRRTEFTNRELRLDSSLGLPVLKDNLESRLILLRKRLLEKCPDVRIVPVARGRFALQVDCAPQLVQKERG